MSIKRNFVYFVSGNSQPPIPKGKQNYLVMFENNPDNLFSIDSRGKMNNLNSSVGSENNFPSIIQRKKVTFTQTEVKSMEKNPLILISGEKYKITILKNILVKNIDNSNNLSTDFKIQYTSSIHSLIIKDIELSFNDWQFHNLIGGEGIYRIKNNNIGKNLIITKSGEESNFSASAIEITATYIQITETELFNLSNFN